MRTLYKFSWDCGRMGDVDGLFIAESEEVEAAIGKELYFGEILGKHSEVHGTFEADDVRALTCDPDLVDTLFDAFDGNKDLCGYNPLNYVQNEEDYE
jgi:hypothetical protein